MKPKAPKHLSREAKTFWKQVAEEYAIDDSAGLRILLTACEALDAMRAAEAQVAADGLMIPDAKGRSAIHPATKVVRDSRSQMLLALKQLNLDLEPIKAVGRPPGR